MRSLRQKLDRLEERLRPPALGRCPHCGIVRANGRGPCAPGIVFHEEGEGRMLVICKWCGWCYRGTFRMENGICIGEGVEEAESPL